MSIKRNVSKEVEAMGRIDITGNVIPPLWYQNLRVTKKTKNSDSNKPYLLAIVILSDIVYWYKPTYIRDETTSQVIEIKKKFAGDKLQRNPYQIAEMLGVSKMDASEALRYLRDKKLITTELRTITKDDKSIPNVMYIGVIPENIEKISTYQLKGSSQLTTTPTTQLTTTPTPQLTTTPTPQLTTTNTETVHTKISNTDSVLAPEKIETLQSEKEKETPPSSAAPPSFNANARKTYQTHLEIYADLVMFWKTYPMSAETINTMIEPLGMGSQFPKARKLFFDYVQDIFCTSIKKLHKEPISVFDLHDIVIQKIAYSKRELSELVSKEGKEVVKEKKMAEIVNKPYFTPEQENIIVMYCQERTGYTYTNPKDYRDCQDIKAQRIYLQATSNIENTKKYLISKNLIAA